ncbi:hypothetical protein JTB14_001245 [Gonioctena quinquepunctata]|nr:hypothetical protein JTB14_001245 [Gonioctena quinquepunctata]
MELRENSGPHRRAENSRKYREEMEKTLARIYEIDDRAYTKRQITVSTKEIADIKRRLETFEISEQPNMDAIEERDMKTQTVGSGTNDENTGKDSLGNGVENSEEFGVEKKRRGKTTKVESIKKFEKDNLREKRGGWPGGNGKYVFTHGQQRRDNGKLVSVWLLSPSPRQEHINTGASKDITRRIGDTSKAWEERETLTIEIEEEEEINLRNRTTWNSRKRKRIEDEMEDEGEENVRRNPAEIAQGIMIER